MSHLHIRPMRRSISDTVSSTPYTRMPKAITPLIEEGFRSYTPFIRSRLPDGYGYLLRNYTIFPLNSPNTSDEISDRMSDEYYTQALIWIARGRKENPWIHRCKLVYPVSPGEIFTSNLCHELWQPKWLNKFEQGLKESFARVFSPEALARTYNILPESRLIARFIPSDEETDVFDTPIKAGWWCYISTQEK